MQHHKATRARQLAHRELGTEMAQVRRAAPQGTESGDFDTRWLLFLIPIILVFLILILLAWRYNIMRRKQKQRRSVLRNVTLVIADEERAEERRLNRGHSLASRMSRMGSIRSSNHTGHTSGYGTSSTKYASLREKHLRNSRDLSFYPPTTGKRPASLLSHRSSQFAHGTQQKQQYHSSSGIVGLHSPPPLSPDSRIISLHRIDSDAKSQQDARNAIISAGPIHGRRRSSLGLKRPDLSGSRAGSASGHGSGNEKASSHGHNEKASSHGHGSGDDHSRLDPGEVSDSSSHVAAVSWAPISALPTAVTRTQSHDRLLHRTNPASVVPMDAQQPSRSSSKASGSDHASDTEASDGQRGSSWKTRASTGGQRTRSSALTAIGERGPEVPAKESAALVRSGSISSSNNSHNTMHRGILKSSSDRIRTAASIAKAEQASASPSSAGTGSSAQASSAQTSQLSSPAVRKPVPSEDAPKSAALLPGLLRKTSQRQSAQSGESSASTPASGSMGADATSKPVLSLQTDESVSTSSPQFTASPIAFIRKSADMARPLGMPWKLKRANTGEHDVISKANIGAPSALSRASLDGAAVSRSSSDASAWAYQSKAAEWRAAAAAKSTGEQHLDEVAADSSAGTAEGLQVPSMPNPMQRTASIGAAGSVFKENFEEEEGEGDLR